MNGRSVFVTGGGSGLGATTAQRLAIEGARVVVGDLDFSAAQKVANAINADGYIAYAQEVDVTCHESLEAVVQKSVERFGKLDGVFACAGITTNGTVVDMPESDWDRIMQVNLKGVFLTCKQTIPFLERAGGGSIVPAGSITSFTGVSKSCAYAASKAALVSFSRNMALDYAKSSIRVNLVCPGHCETPLVQELFRNTQGLRESLIARYPMGRLSDEREIANAVLFLLSDESSFVTGTELVVDGGFLAA
ncbi:glucose 1-dehydrogenase [Cognatishimia sp. WU-CL00825]|uniref:SDR family NAD(P)-dependent oxidoreductase n=1 Tax=Cognatishimia sp. WU-CL00825 TaxID=3127658 RepID=UPI003104F706